MSDDNNEIVASEARSITEKKRKENTERKKQIIFEAINRRSKAGCFYTTITFEDDINKSEIINYFRNLGYQIYPNDIYSYYHLSWNEKSTQIQIKEYTPTSQLTLLDKIIGITILSIVTILIVGGLTFYLQLFFS